MGIFAFHDDREWLSGGIKVGVEVRADRKEPIWV